jgi:membrane protease YdiL (CAAX protease family)
MAAIALFKAFVFVLGTVLVSSPSIYAWLRSAPPGGVLTPGLLLFGEGTRTAAALLVGLAMAKFEDRTFSDYRVPWSEALGKRFWQGVPFGLGTLGLLMSCLYLFRAVSFVSQDLEPVTVLRNGVLYGTGYVLVAFFEEASFRGYMQATIETEFGFWPSAVVLSVIFGAIHLQNPGESHFGVAMAGCFGLLAAFSVLRTGSIWFAVGLHAAWDWAQSFLYGVPNSGVLARGPVWNCSVHGPNWLTGGSVGPEGSLLVLPVLLLLALAIHLLFPASRSDC